MSLSEGSLKAFVEYVKAVSPDLVRLIAPSNDEELEQAFIGWMKRAIQAMESDKATFRPLNEDSISSLMSHLLSLPGIISVRRENHCNGHVDLTIEIGMGVCPRRRLCEAKLYSGPAYHIKGLQQLLLRYCTGRDKRAILLSYVKQADISSLIKKVRDEFDMNKPERQVGGTTDHPLIWSFTSDHMHSSGEVIRVDHLACNLH